MIDELKQWEYDKGYEKGKADTLKVIEDIKAEINTLIDDTDNIYGTSALHKVLEIIDKHIGGDNE